MTSWGTSPIGCSSYGSLPNVRISHIVIPSTKRGRAKVPDMSCVVCEMKIASLGNLTAHCAAAFLEVPTMLIQKI